MERMEAEIEAYRDWVRRMKIWKKLIEHDYNVDKMTFDELWVLYEMNMSPPECPTKSGQFPCFACVFDDLIGCRVFIANLSGLGNHLLISHRHYSCSVFILSQSITNFIPKQIRSNNIGLWILFPNKYSVQCCTAAAPAAPCPAAAAPAGTPQVSARCSTAAGGCAAAAAGSTAGSTARASSTTSCTPTSMYMYMFACMVVPVPNH
jgi:hypothetical protein